MTFNDIANTTCAKLGELDGDSIVACLGFAKNWYRVLWNNHNWISTRRHLLLNIPANTAGWFMDHIYGEIINIGWAQDLVTTPLRGEYRDMGWIKTNDPFAIVPGTLGPLPRYYWKSFTRGVPIINDGNITVTITPNTVGSASLVVSGVNNILSGNQLLPASTNINRDVYNNEELNVGIPAFTPQSTAQKYTEITSLSLVSNTTTCTIAATSANNTWTKVSNLSEEKFVFNYYQVYPVITSNFYVYIEAKMKLPDVLQNDDNLAIDNCDDAILALTQADMLERKNMYQEAGMKKQEGQGLIEEAKKILRQQADYVDQITPSVYDNAWRLYWIYPYRF